MPPYQENMRQMIPEFGFARFFPIPLPPTINNILTHALRFLAENRDIRSLLSGADDIDQTFANHTIVWQLISMFHHLREAFERYERKRTRELPRDLRSIEDIKSRLRGAKYACDADRRELTRIVGIPRESEDRSNGGEEPSSHGYNIDLGALSSPWQAPTPEPHDSRLWLERHASMDAIRDVLAAIDMTEAESFDFHDPRWQVAAMSVEPERPRGRRGDGRRPTPHDSFDFHDLQWQQDP
ncbi:MAG: hypothetical protein M1833_003727 [Piccolia ochrophora]|nr:MAG: hypothetical protein M1833_003727 [Piccolia ochrophora]